MTSRPAWISGLLSLVFAAIFLADLYGMLEAKRHPVAYVRTADGVVRHLPAGELSWDLAQRGTLLDLGDALLTSDLPASVRFFEGAQLELDPTTLVIVGGGLDDLKLNFLRGDGELFVARAAREKIRLASATRKPTRLLEDRDLPRETPEAARAASTESVRSVRPARASALASVELARLRNPSAALGTRGRALTTRSLPPIPQPGPPADESHLEIPRGQAPVLTWSLVGGGPQFRYEVQVRPANPSPAARGPEPRIFRTDRLSLALTDFSTGRYLWSVRAIAPDGRRGPASPTRALEIQRVTAIAKPRLLPVKVE